MKELKLILMIGVSGSGKTTIAERLASENGYIRISTDDIRLELTGDASDQSKNGLVFTVAHQRTDWNLNDGNSVVIDATNLNPKDRKEFIAIGQKYSADISAHVVRVSVETAKLRNSLRERQVPEFVIDKQINKFIHPTIHEGIRDIKVIIN